MPMEVVVLIIGAKVSKLAVLIPTATVSASTVLIDGWTTSHTNSF